MGHLLNPLDFSVEEVDRLLDLVANIEHNLSKYAHVCNGKKITTLFCEPSTRTRLGFEFVMLSLDGGVLGFSSAASSSATKRESVSDTIHIASCYADVYAMRYPKEGTPLVASTHSPIPAIDASGGGHQHPTQTLTDLVTIRSLQGCLDNMTVGLCSDLKLGHTVRPLINVLVRYPGIEFVLISPPELQIPRYIREDVLAANNIESEKVSDLDEATPESGILYMTRMQEEYFSNEEGYIRLKDCYALDNAKMKLAKEKMPVLHLLSRVNETSVEMDDDPRAAYLHQVQYGAYVRMVLIMTLLEVEKPC